MGTTTSGIEMRREEGMGTAAVMTATGHVMQQRRCRCQAAAAAIGASGRNRAELARH
jgi:hypothetical protein